jgi:dihydrofolate synthase / folylpolyglutamate synthase
VVGASGEPEAVPILGREAQRAGVAALTVIDVDAIASVPERLGLAGPHQRANAACALAVVDHLEALFGRLPTEARARGLAECRLPGRLELVASAPAVFVDGAHNPQAARALSAAVREMKARRVLVLAVSRDKDAVGIAAALAPIVDEIVVTATRHERALDPVALAEAVRAAAPSASVRRAPDTAAALALARDLAGPDGSVIVAGSLFLAGEAREILCGEAADPRMVTDPLP